MAIGIEVDGNGISLKSYREIRESLAEKMKGIFGDDLDLSPSSPDGQLLDLFGYAYSDAAEAIAGGTSSLNLNSAEGTFLDNIGHLMGYTRGDDEDDDSFRARLLDAEPTGLATFDGMLSYLRDALGAGVALVENPEPTADSSGIPGHSVAVYIPEVYSSIPDNDIAQAIWNCKPAGIRAYGTSSGMATDVAGTAHSVSFFRVTGGEPFFLRVTISEYTEEVLPTDYVRQLKKSIADWAVTEYTRGKDIIPQRVIQAIYKVPGIDTVNVEASMDGNTWTGSRIPVLESSYATLPEENIRIVGP